ncbi:MAG: restriction endonuclease subunit S [Sedimenticola sp.]|nr:restriction endonuclease subunit S [Sedimenticola sp.]
MSGVSIGRKTPGDWGSVQLKAITKRITKGSTPTSYGYSYTEEGVKFIKAENIDSFGNASTTSNYIDDETHEFLARSQLQKNDILFSIAGTIGRVGVVRENDLPANTNQALAIVRLVDGVLDTRYLFHYLNSPQIQQIALKNIVGVGRANLSLTNIGEFLIPVAPLEQQKRIVAKIEELFSHIDAGIEALNKAKQLLKQYRQSVLKAAVTGELTKEWREQNKDKLEPASRLLERILQERRQKWEEQQLEQFKAKGKMPKDNKWKEKYKEPKPFEGELFPVPEEWCWAYIGQLAEVIGGLTKNRKREQLELKLPYLRVANVYANELRLGEVSEIGVLESELDRLLLQEGDLLVVEGNGSPDQIGRLAIWDGSIHPCVHQNHLIKVRLSQKDSGGFLMHWLASIGGRDAILNVASSTSGLYTLSISKIEGLPVPLAPLEEMIEIEAIVSEKNTSLNRLDREIDRQLVKAEKNKQSILASAFSGELVDGVDSDGSAKELLEKIRKQHFLHATKEKLAKKRKPAKTKGEPMAKKKIIDVLKVTDKALTPEKLFDLIGADGSSPDEIEGFYVELKEVLKDKNVVVETVIDKDVKKGDLISYKDEA